MKAEELRIGNYAAKRLKSGSGRTLDAPLGVQDIVRIKENTGSFIYEPIPLTEEWIVKGGFKSGKGKQFKSDNYYTKHFLGSVLVVNWSSIANEIHSIGIIHPDIDDTLSNFCWHIKHVHRFQNIIHALTCEELTFS